MFSLFQEFADWLVYGLMRLDEASHLSVAINFFVFDVLKITVLLLVINFFMSIVRHYVPTHKIKRVLTGRRWYGMQYVLGAGFGMITPFCSCSSIPLFVGFVRAGIPLGVVFSFMITSPLVNQVGVVVFAGMFGPMMAGLYLLSGLAIGSIAGMLIQRLKLDDLIRSNFRPDNQELDTVSQDTSSKAINLLAIRSWWLEGLSITKQLMPYVLVGIGLGSLIHGYVPAGFFEQYLSQDQIWSVPLATIVALPLYSNVVAVIPIIEALVTKGVPLGTAMAFMLSIVGMSLPELLILRKVVETRLLVVYYGLVTMGIITIGYLFNFIL